MGRVLRLACGLMGVVVLLTTASMAWARRDESAWMLVEEGNWNLETRLVVIDPKTTYQFPLTDYGGYVYTRAYDRKSGWIYYERGDGLYRTKFDGLTEPELIIPDTTISQVWLAPSGNWIVYSTAESVGDYHVYRLFRAKSDGRDTINLNASDGSGLPNDIYYVSFSDDEDQVTFTVGNSAYIAQMDGTGTKLSYSQVVTRPPNGAPMVARLHGQLYLIDPFDSNTMVPFAASDDNQWYQYFGWLPNTRIAILKVGHFDENDDKFLGVEAQQGVLWSIDKAFWYEATPREEWVFVSSVGWIDRIRPDGSQHERIFEIQDIEIFEYMVTDNWLIILTYDRPNEDFRIHRIRHTGQGLTEILKFPKGGDVRLVAWTEDEKYLIFSNIAGYSFDRELYRMKADGSDTRSLTPGSDGVHFALWLPPIDRGWTPSHLGIIGVGLIGIFIIRPKKWWDKEH